MFKRKFRFALLIVLVLLLTGVLAAQVLAEEPEIVASGTCGDHVSWTLDKEGTLTISGTGEMGDYYMNTAPWSSHSLEIKQILIQDGVTSIGSHAFYGLLNMNRVTIPDSVTRIDTWAFCACHSLEEVTIPDSVTKIGNKAFGVCLSLASVEVPDSVTSFGTEVFYNCDKLSSVVLGNGIQTIPYRTFGLCESLETVRISDNLKSIGDEAFYFCTALQEISIPEGVTKIGESAFRSCKKLETITLPESLKTFGDYAFMFCTAMKQIHIPKNVKTIPYEAFLDCSGLEQLVLSEGLTTIETWAFQDCTGLRSVTIPSSLETIEYCAFFNCDGIEQVHVSDLAAWCSIAFERGTSNPLYYGADLYINGALSDGNPILPEGTEKIGQFAFVNCDFLGTITVPGSVRAIEDYAFYRSGLTQITFLGDAPAFTSKSFYYDLPIVAYFPAHNPTWSKDTLKNYDGKLEWIPYVNDDSPHIFTAAVTEPTCETEGYTTYSCLCGESYVTDFKEIVPHQYTAVVTPATCMKEGYTTYSCSCGDEYIDDYTDLAPHTPGQYVAGAFGEDGSYQLSIRCSVCGEAYIRQRVACHGDVNGDGAVDIFDANLIAAGYNEIGDLDPVQLYVGDVNGDGNVDIFDANLIAAYYNEVIGVFPGQ